MRHLELKIPPLALCAAFAVAIAIAASAHLAPTANLPVWGHRAIAIAVMLIGIAVAAAGVIEFRRAKTTVNPLAETNGSSLDMPHQAVAQAGHRKSAVSLSFTTRASPPLSLPRRG